MRKIFHIGAGCHFLSTLSRDLEPALIKVFKQSARGVAAGIALKEFRHHACIIHGWRDAANVLTGLKNSYAFAVAGIFDVCIHRTAFLDRAAVPIAFRDGHDKPGGPQPPPLR